MIATDPTLRAQKHIALLESWEESHVAAMNCRDLEGLLNEGVQVFQMLRQEDDHRRAMIRSGEIPPEAAAIINPAIIESYAEWLQAARKLAGRIEQSRREFDVVEHSEAFLEAMSFAADVVSGKRLPAVLSKCPGLRFDQLTTEDAEEIEAILNAPPGSPGKLMVPLARVPIGDVSLLR
jgi:hypothetical protein